MPFDAPFDALFKMAAKKPISVFKQGVHSGKDPQWVVDPKHPSQQWSLPQDLYTQVKGGFCAGASLDWLRKVLQREDKKGVDHLKSARVMRMAQTFTKLDGSKVINKQKADLALVRDRVKSDYHQWVRANGGTVTPDGNTSISGTPEVLNMFDQKADEVRRLSAEISRMVDDYNALSDAGKRAAVWDRLVMELGTDAGKKRKYSGICPVACNPKQAFPTLRDYLVAALSAPAFSPGRGMIVGISLIPEPGHDIALQRDLTGSVYLFDPNLGVYQFQNFTLLVMGLIVLLDLGYAGKDSQGKVTALGSSHDWQVFAKVEAGLPLVDPAGALANEEQVRLAYDEAKEIIDGFRENVEETLGQELREAQKRSVEYEKQQTSALQKAWVEAHNDAVKSFDLLRGADLQEAKAIYPKFTGNRIRLT